MATARAITKKARGFNVASDFWDIGQFIYELFEDGGVSEGTGNACRFRNKIFLERFKCRTKTEFYLKVFNLRPRTAQNCFSVYRAFGIRIGINPRTKRFRDLMKLGRAKLYLLSVCITKKNYQYWLSQAKELKHEDLKLLIAGRENEIEAQKEARAWKGQTARRLTEAEAKIFELQEDIRVLKSALVVMYEGIAGKVGVESHAA